MHVACSLGMLASYFVIAIPLAAVLMLVARIGVMGEFNDQNVLFELQGCQKTSSELKSAFHENELSKSQPFMIIAIGMNHISLV